MARADLLIRLVESISKRDVQLQRKVIEAIIAEERTKQHTVLADKLFELLNNNEPKINTYKNFLSDNRGIDLVFEKIPQRKLQDLILSNDNIEICEEFFQEHFRRDLLRSFNIEPRNKILLIGPPGNGKTSLAEAIAESLAIPLIIVRYDKLIGSYLGETAARINKIIEYVSARNCVLFFDEFETLGKERGDLHETGEIKRVVSSLLLQIDDLPSHVIVVGATNHPELLDRAVWRRFQIRLNLELPTKANLRRWWSEFEKRMNFNSSSLEDIFIQKFHKKSFSELEEFGNSGLRKYILNQPNCSIEEILEKLLNKWSKQKADKL